MNKHSILMTPMRRRIPTLFCLFLISCWNVSAQDCDALLIQGHRNIQARYSAGASVTAKFMRHCSTETVSDSSTALKLFRVDELDTLSLKGIEVEFFGYNKDRVRLDESAHLGRLQNWCTQHQPMVEENLALYAAAQPMYAEAIEARNQCAEYEKNHKILVEPFISPDARTVDIWIRSERWENKTSERSLRSPLQGVKTENFDCIVRVPTDGTIEEVQAGRLHNLDADLDLNILDIHCTRAPPKKVQLAPWYSALFSTSDSTAIEIQQRGLIEVMMEDKSLQIFFAEESKAPMVVIDKLEKQNTKMEERILKLENQMKALQKATSEDINQLSANEQANKRALDQKINMVQTTLGASIAVLQSKLEQ